MGSNASKSTSAEPAGTSAARQPTQEVATLAGGCFWCVEAVLEQLRGVARATSGYAGGTDRAPDYAAVSSGNTGHAEAVQVVYDPSVLSFRQLLEVFFTSHDPTTLNRQGADVGTQYRSVIFYHDEAQRATAKAVMSDLEAAGIWDAPIVTELVPLTSFHEAEAHHQGYYGQNADQAYCRLVIAPKVARLRQRHRALLRE